MDKTACIYHANCDDGFTAAWIVATKYPGAELIEGKYGEDFDVERIRDKVVFIVDFSYKPEKMVEIIEEAKQVIWLDHHKTAIEAWDNYLNNSCYIAPDSFFCTLDMNRSGAGITWDCLYQGMDAPPLVQFVQDNDLWRFELEGTKDFINYLRTFERTLKNWDTIAGMRISQVVVMGAAITAYIENKVAETVAMCASRISIGDLDGYIANAPYSIASDLGNALARRKGSQFGMTWYVTSSKKVVFSLRSIGDVDISAIAKKFGGGGHKNAAGFVMNFESPEIRRFI
jgi:oligoribonuclease NrnB/cAMP/cGMP phosphodiesterase (DHH superfamily)